MRPPTVAGRTRALGHLRCRTCDAAAPPAAWRCPACAGPLAYESPSRAFPRDAITAGRANLWRWAEALPDLGADRVSLGEAPTPLLPVDTAAILGADGPTVLVKVEGQLPSGSYKDRGAATLIGWLKRHGVTHAVEDSSGNAGAALATYAARAGIGLRVFCPDSASPGKLAQIRAAGAELTPVPGPRPRATEALLAHLAAHPDTCYASHLWHPLFLEGVRTLAWEIAEQLGWRLPDWVVCPVGAGSILLGLHAGFADLVAAGVGARAPRLLAVQSERRRAVVDAFAAGAARVTPADVWRPTVAEGIAVAAPVRDVEVLAALRDTDGTAVAVPEAAIVDGLRHLGAGGFYVEPTSAVVWPGLAALHARRPLARDATVVLVLSGHGLKAGTQIAALLDA